jgi:hypothetical protein
MPQIYLEKKLYDELVRQRKDPAEFVNDTVRKALGVKKDE